MAQVEVTMPKMGESITEGTVIVWHKKPGDAVEADETLLEIGTDKVDTEVPSPAAGILKEILVEEGETVDVGTALAIIATDGEEAGATEDGGEETRAGAGEPGAAQAGAEEEPAEADSEDEADAESEPEPETEPTTVDAQDEPEAEEEPHLETRPAGDAVEVVMPKMGESITEGTIITWFKKVGDLIEEDEILLEIATDKVDTEVPSPAAGTLQEILVEEGETVEVGTAIARIGGEAAGADAAAEKSERAPAAAAGKVPVPREPQGEEKRETAARPASAGDGAPAAATAEPAGEIARKGADGRFYSPLVRSIAEKEGLSMRELEQIEGSGRDRRVTKEDVLAYIEGRREGGPAEAGEGQRAPASAKAVRPAPAPGGAGASAAGYEGRTEIVEMDRMRQIIAEHMVRSKATSAHVTSFAEADVTNLVRLRERNKDVFQKREGVKLTFTPFFVQAAVQALHDHPLFNASVDGARIILKKDLHIGIAVAIGKKGLVAPVIQNAQDRNLVGLAKAAADMAERARNKQLQPDELQGGTFTLTNIGSLGSIMGTPIINQPQVGILATGAIKKRPVVIEDPELGDLIAIRHMMYLSLSYDHRIIDGAMGASFLQRFIEVLESYDPNEEL